jgi:hypothetical protein
MANNLTMFDPTNAPDFARNRKGTSTFASALAGGSGSSGYPHRISIKGGVFRLIDNGKQIAALEERHIDVVFINAADKVSRIYYEGKFVEGETTAPVCQSSDGLKPDAVSTKPQCDTCANCDQNIKGSGTGDTKACRYQQRIAVVTENNLEGMVMQLTCPARSLFGKEENGWFPLQAYGLWLKGQGVEPNEVVTRVKFDTSESAPKLLFKAIRWLDDEEFSTADSKGQTADAKRAVLLNDSGSAGSLPPPSRSPALAKPAQKAVEQEADADEVDTPPPPKKTKAKAKAEATVEEEPVVRKAAQPATLPASKSLASIAEAWDTDD